MIALPSFVAQIGETKYQTLEEAFAAATAGQTVELIADTYEDIVIPAEFGGTLAIGTCKLNSITNNSATAKIVINGNVVVENSNGSAITGEYINISGNGTLTAIANGDHAYGIGGDNTKSITIENVHILKVQGGHYGEIGTDTKYYKDAPEGGAAIGSSFNGAVITLTNVEIEEALGGSKAAGIGAEYHTGVTINITDCVIKKVEGGATAAGIGGSRVSNGATAVENVVINILNSNITAVGGVYAAGIGSGYDTHCQANQPICTINIDGSTINATGGQYAAGIGTGYHNAGLAGEITNSTITAASGDKVYKDSYTPAQDIGFGVADLAREGSDNDSFITYNGTVIALPRFVAQIGEAKYKTLAEALAAAQDGDTITLLWTEGDAPIAMNGAVYGKSVTITGTATVDWSKGFLFIGRGGAGNGTVTFENANLTSASDNASTGIHVSGREKNTDNKYDGTLVINNSTIELDYLINKGTMTLDNSTLTVKNGFAIGGRPASETENGVDATATLDLTNGSKVVVNNHNGMGLGYEAIGVMNIDASSTFETTQSFLVTAKGTMNIAGTAKVAGTLTNNGSIVLTAVDATLTSNECGNVTTNLADHKVEYADGIWTVVAEILGDISGNREVNVMDVILLRKYIVGLVGETEINKSVADLNEDGIINVLDVVLLRLLIADNN